jgi:hypothetical protein
VPRILVADVIARPVDRLPESGSLALVDEVVLRGGGGCAVTHRLFTAALRSQRDLSVAEV